jgi:ParB-like chromosome segregation protein Spo0J
MRPPADSSVSALGRGTASNEKDLPIMTHTTTDAPNNTGDSIIQPMPALDPDQWDALAADIVANGVLVPVVKDQHGRILDGNNRAAIATKLGIDYPVIVVEVTDDQDAYDRAVSLNCARRHLNREQKRELIAAELTRRPEQSDRAIANRVGASPTTVGTVRAAVNRVWCDAEAEEYRRIAAIKAEQKRQAEELTAQAAAALDNELGQLAMTALLQHIDGIPWQVVGNTLERHFRNGLSLCECSGDLKLCECGADDDCACADPELSEAMWRHVYGPFFDDMRATDCAEIRDEPCTVCTDADREWRDNHPERVYRWRVSNLDSAEAVVVR